MGAETNRVALGSVLLREHRLWRPDWVAGQAHLMWYLTFEAQPRVPARVRELQARLAGVPMLDVVPLQWLHCTIDAVGPVDAVATDDVDAVVAAAAAQLVDHAAPTLGLGPVAPMEDSLVLSMGPVDELSRLRNALRAATTSVLGEHRPHDMPAFEPHVTIGYVNTACQADGLLGRFADVHDEELTVVPHSVVLAAVTRQERHYDWTTTAVLPLPTAA